MWAAANDGSRKRSRSDAGGNLSDGENDSETSSDGERSTTESIHENNDNTRPCATQGRKKPKRKLKKRSFRENPEATLARLTSSYSVAMAAVGALHRVSRQYSNQNENDTQKGSGDKSGDSVKYDLLLHQSDNQENKSSETINNNENLQMAHTAIQRVAYAARSVFERSLLLDHVILAPIILPTNNCQIENDYVSGTSSAWFITWNCDSDTNNAIGTAQWNRFNASHRNIIKRISYLTLTNYGDLLLCGCVCHRSSLFNDGLVELDALDFFAPLEAAASQNIEEVTTNGHSFCCLWQNETRERTIRLAVAAYCDASDLDSTDPTLWLKLACAARALGKDSESNVAPPAKSFRCLERLAIERGLSSLPKRVPPNRMLLRAWREIQARDRRCGTDSESSRNELCAPKKKAPVKWLLELPRYSWSAVGKILLDASQTCARKTCLSGRVDSDFGSPLIDIKISPLLTVPSKVTKGITGCLERDDVNNLMLTCRSIAEVLETTEAKAKKVSLSSCISVDKDLMHTLDNQLVMVGDDSKGGIDSSTKGREENAMEDITSPRRGRVSKRVQSQAITSEKQSERRAKRSSAEYCLLAGVLSSTSQNPSFRNLLKTGLRWENLLMGRCIPQLQAFLPAQTGDGPQSSATLSLKEKNEFSAPSSLSTFIQHVCGVNSGPMDALERFLVHVSLHVSDVFGSENSDTLSSCVMGCFDTISRRSGSCSELISPWYGEEVFDEGIPLERALQVLSVNLLAAELRFKRWQSNDAVDHSNDGIMLDFVVPNLLQCVSVMSKYDASDDQRPLFLELLCRCNWLTSTYYTWLGHCCNDISVSKAADEIGLECLDVCLESMSEYQQLGADQTIETPHLVSPDRHGSHWASLSVDVLLKYKQYLLSTTVVSKIRQDFHKIVCQLNEGVPPDSEPFTITEDQKNELSLLGAELVNRYKSGNDQVSEKIEEVLNDFIIVHGDHLAPQNDESILHDWKVVISKLNDRDVWGNVWSAVPCTKTECIDQISSTLFSGPSIMHVLSCSLLLSEGDMQPLLSIYCQLISSAFESRARILQSCAEDRNERGNIMLLASRFFVDKMSEKISKEPTGVHHELEGDLCKQTILSVIRVYLDIHSEEPKEGGIDQSHPSRPDLFNSALHLVFAIRKIQGLSSATRHQIESTYFVGLVKAMIQGKHEFASLTTSVIDKRLKTWQLQLNNKADEISFIANELAELMSQCTTSFDSDGNLKVSHLMKGLTGLGDEDNQTQTPDFAPLAQFSDSLLWFWDFLNNSTDATSPAENSVKDRLLVPICATMIALCGSPSVLNLSSVSENKHSPTNSDFFDSDDSVNGVFLPDSSIESESQRFKKNFTRKYSQLTQCISIAFDFGERAACRVEGCYPSSQHGPFLSLVTVRTLSSLADQIFRLFSEDIWNEEWPYGARECGVTLDSVLSKAYNCIYGFSLTGQTPNSDSSKSYAPESIMAAAQLFRSVKRVYNRHNRRSPPIKAFETMEMALPSIEENAVSKAITGYMFDADKNVDALRLSRMENPPGFPEWVFDERESVISCSRSDEDINYIEILRRGICRELAKGPITHMGSNEADEDIEGLSIERESTQRYELSLSRKFRAVLCDLSYDPRNIENWMVLSECLGFKADIICDRLVRATDPYNTSDFFPPMKPNKSSAAWNLDQLHRTQCDQFQELRKNWFPFIGRDLRAYIEYPWSNLNSLRDCSKDIELSLSEEDSQVGDLLVWRDIEAIFEKGEYASWANAWAGMFITALRTMRMKALLVARYLAKKKLGNMHPSEVCEDIGTAVYGDLMASTVHGFPIQHMSYHEKRAIAEEAKFYFEEAIDSSKSSDYTCDNKTESWEVQFMIGKCCEKIASTVREEIFPRDTCQQKRLYEKMMTEAIRNYSVALSDAQQAEKSGGGQENKGGGSSHGSREVLYRLHASRLKVLLSAIRQASDTRGLAEIEAYRITSTSWFDESNKLESSIDHVRDNTWDVFVDSVQGLASCRKGISYFHRSTYRLSQALLWAPVFHDPRFFFRIGSMENVPLSKRNRISELDKDSFAECASSVIESLFDKKRAHLVAVWVTTSTAPPPFEVLNDSVRKYDALRLKYIRAFIDTMVVCKRRDKIETFLSWAMSSSQDLPGFYESSAATFRGAVSEKYLQSGSGFLTKVKRAAIAALAKMILKDLAMMKKIGIDEYSKKLLKEDFKLSHKLLLCLQLTPDDILRAAHSNEPLVEAVAFFRCYLSIQSDRINDSFVLAGNIDDAMLSSLLEGAVAKAKEMFPPKKSKLKTLKRQADDPV